MVDQAAVAENMQTIQKILQTLKIVLIKTKMETLKINYLWTTGRRDQK